MFPPQAPSSDARVRRFPGKLFFSIRLFFSFKEPALESRHAPHFVLRFPLKGEYSLWRTATGCAMWARQMSWTPASERPKCLTFVRNDPDETGGSMYYRMGRFGPFWDVLGT